MSKALEIKEDYVGVDIYIESKSHGFHCRFNIMKMKIGVMFFRNENNYRKIKEELI